MMYNYSKLLGIMKEKGVTQSHLSDKIGISEASLNKKLKNNSQFKPTEMEAILSFLSIPMEQLESIFFTH